MEIDSQNGTDISNINTPDLKDQVIRHLLSCYLNLRGRYTSMLPDVTKRMPGVDVHGEVTKKAKERENENGSKNDQDQDQNDGGTKFTKRRQALGNHKRKVCQEIQEDPLLKQMTPQ